MLQLGGTDLLLRLQNIKYRLEARMHAENHSGFTTGLQQHRLSTHRTPTEETATANTLIPVRWEKLSVQGHGGSSQYSLEWTGPLCPLFIVLQLKSLFIIFTQEQLAKVWMDLSITKAQVKFSGYLSTVRAGYLLSPTWPCFQHSLKIFQLFLLLGSWRQSSLPSQSQEWEVCGSSTFKPITISFTSLCVSARLLALLAASDVFLFSTTEAMIWSKKLGRLALPLAP